MPLYEYSCRDCEKEFELLVRGSEPPSCPSCESLALERKLSVFAAHTAGGGMKAASPGACGSCGDPRGPGSCSMN